MVDIHCHIMPGIDDGSVSLEQSLQMLSEAQKAGVKTIIATPHYSGKLHESGKVKQAFELLRIEALRCGIELQKGYEIKIHHYRARMPADFHDLDLSGSKYVLLELPHDIVPSYTLELIYKLQLEGFTPIIAHPERCRKLVKSRQVFEELYNSGCLMQIDAASILGNSGGIAKRFAKKLIKTRKAMFIASDSHDPTGYTKWLPVAYKKVCKWADREEADRLFSRNAADMILQRL